MSFVETTISALVQTLASEHAGSSMMQHGGQYPSVAEFAIGQVAHLTAPLRLPMRVATAGLSVLALVSAGSLLHRLPVERRRLLVDSWRHSHISAIRDVIRFYESLTVLSLFSLENP